MLNSISNTMMHCWYDKVRQQLLLSKYNSTTITHGSIVKACFLQELIQVSEVSGMTHIHAYWLL